MCFSLPTLDDPFNDRHGKEEFKRTGPKKKTHIVKEEKVPLGGKGAARRKSALSGNKKSNNLQTKNESVTVNNNLGLKCGINTERKNIEVTEMAGICGGAQQHDCELSEFPSKFVFLCLNSIENALRHGDAYSDGEGNALFVDLWGLEFLKCYSTGKDLIETSGTSATTAQIAWMVSGAADTFVRKEKQGLSFGSPFLLFLVPSQERAVQVR